MKWILSVVVLREITLYCQYNWYYYSKIVIQKKVTKVHILQLSTLLIQTTLSQVTYHHHHHYYYYYYYYRPRALYTYNVSSERSQTGWLVVMLQFTPIAS